MATPVQARPLAPPLELPEDDEPNNSPPVTPLADQSIPTANREVLAAMEEQRQKFWNSRGMPPARLQIQGDIELVPVLAGEPKDMASPVHARPPAPALELSEDDEPTSHPATPLADQLIPAANREALAAMAEQRRKFWHSRGMPPARLQIQAEIELLPVPAGQPEEAEVNAPKTPPPTPKKGGDQEVLNLAGEGLVDLRLFLDHLTPKGS